ncbi:LysR family transcriptional regulator [Temperatibacter marinus]|uniref:LysR family transcriptional regulator n=1 Tax=Temperatibacter marinus TaxID=1456591 RepID=A0AA52EDV5_9PROT|nr:LysR family transcriptional regulator [Temperatibacter marinus]WND02971.1 LysR family transcriptional regulator [Temperatibacter marinus]
MKRDLDKFHLMKVFHAVATQGSFTKGAAKMGMTVSSVSKAVQQLEAVLNVKLMHRTTRTLSLTDSGNEYLNASEVMLNDLSELEARLYQRGTNPSGLLKVTAPISVGQCLLAPRLHVFHSQFPDINLSLNLADNVSNISAEGYDVAIRSIKAAETSPLFSMVVASHGRKLVASPSYMESIDLLNDPLDLSGLNLLSYNDESKNSSWEFQRSNSHRVVYPKPLYSSNNYNLLLQSALDGMGIANLYDYLVDDAIGDGRLCHVLPEWEQSERTLYALYQQKRMTSPKLDKFLEFLENVF